MISRLCRYIEKVFDFSLLLRELRDSRLKPQIPCWAVFASGFTMFLMRRGSMNALEVDLRVPKRLDGVIGLRKPSADRVGDVYACMDSGPVRAMLWGIVRRMARNKVLVSPWRKGFVAVDGHELFRQ